MTSLSIGGVGQNPLQFLQQISGQQLPVGAGYTDGRSTEQTQRAHHHHHGGGGGGGGAVSDLLNTIANALQSADPSSDPNKVIENTVAKLLAGNGTNAGANGTDADGDSDGSAQASSQSSGAQSFAQLLQAHGVDVQQFRSDLLAAVKDAQNGQVNPSTALKSFAPGSSLNLTA